VLNTAVGGIYIYGFILMTPQLYINYKLKSVEHMPQKVMVYRFLNTIIDDLFSFIITMPTMHRISCFRDDVIFVVYLYQRWHYKVDNTRGIYATEKKPIEIEEGGEGLEKAVIAEVVASETSTTVDDKDALISTNPVNFDENIDETKKDR